ncbi:hypothetical protein FIU97_10530 [Roseivivax sp. THAF40]|uniref:hypothetical protein n=1 Tax=unclassified Roseivivax TaxID=2639302 RepID=UPI001268AFB6|nr:MULTISPECIES: hypothetical protein [unclassified Roseivivax]QFS83263.1 hypothetical protein FIV09_10545 [Roseivivax sp. THAF197b]QFT47007.1 hypothetical protein FIU97_10530 [Roseivivax sp. THAF40]
MADPDNDQSLHFLELTLAEAQATVRAYDTKAQIVGIGYTFTLNIVARVSDAFPKAESEALWSALVFWGIVMLPLVLFGLVLFPTRKIAPQVAGATDLELRRTLYVETARYPSVEALEKAARASNWMHEIAFECLKVSRLRELKRTRFIRALVATGVSLATLCALQIGMLV